jgi:hypothetical protein
MLVGERENSPAFVKTSACVNSADGAKPKSTTTAGQDGVAGKGGGIRLRQDYGAAGRGQCENNGGWQDVPCKTID